MLERVGQQTNTQETSGKEGQLKRKTHLVSNAEIFVDQMHLLGNPLDNSRDRLSSRLDNEASETHPSGDTAHYPDPAVPGSLSVIGSVAHGGSCRQGKQIDVAVRPGRPLLFTVIVETIGPPTL